MSARSSGEAAGPECGKPSWAAAHAAHNFVHVDAVRHGPCRHLLAINRVGQVTPGIVGHLRQSCPAQQVNYTLPGELHRNHLVCEIATRMMNAPGCPSWPGRLATPRPRRGQPGVGLTADTRYDSVLKSTTISSP